MPLISLRNANLSFAELTILDRADLDIDIDERICIVGRNGAGKSTLLKVLEGRLALDDGTQMRSPDLRVAALHQEVPADALGGTVGDLVGAGLADWNRLMAAYTDAADRGATDSLANLEARIEAAGGWNLGNRIESTIEYLGLVPEARVAELSGGLRRRALLAAAWVNDPQILLLDEPTNHLDVETIEWLEQTLLNWQGTLIFVTHDRQLVRNLATRILEVDRGHLYSYPGDLTNFERRREARLATEAQQQAEFDRKLGEEEVWIRQGIKARRTRNEGRVRRLQALRRERAARRDRAGVARGTAQQAERSGVRVFETQQLTFGYGDKSVVADFSTLIERGDRIGIVGPNGSGKSTLLRLLLRELEPDSGAVRHGSRLEIAFLDQHRAVLEEDARVRDAIADGDDFIQVGDERRHVIGYLQDFLFTPAQSNARVRTLSGGERGRLNLARLFARPSNVLVLDEPTNDLDIETLELLEEQVSEYAGTVLLVSHDRAFLDNVATALFILDGTGNVREFPGSYSDWAARQKPTAAAARPEKQEPARERRRSDNSRRLSYREQRELDQLPSKIEALEEQIEALQQRLADPSIWQDNSVDTTALSQDLRALEEQHSASFERWEALENAAG